MILQLYLPSTIMSICKILFWWNPV